MTLSIKVSPAKLAAIFIVTALVSAWAADTTVNVLYAGSLVNLMERSAGPAFEQKSGDRFQGYAGGSNKVANEIKGKLRRGDVFISANPKVDDQLMGLLGSQGRDLLTRRTCRPQIAVDAIEVEPALAAEALRVASEFLAELRRLAAE